MPHDDPHEDETFLFNADDHPEIDDSLDGFQPMPPGVYEFEIEKAEIRRSKNGNRMLRMQLRCLGPTYANRVIFDHIMLGGSAEAIEFGLQKFRRLTESLGLLGRPFSVAELIRRVLQISVRTKRQEGFKPQSVVGQYLIDKPVQDHRGNDGQPGRREHQSQLEARREGDRNLTGPENDRRPPGRQAELSRGKAWNRPAPRREVPMSRDVDDDIPF